MNPSVFFVTLYLTSCVYNAYFYSLIIEKHSELNYRLLVLFYVLLGPITSAKLIYWQIQGWWEIKKVRRYLHSPRFAADILKACNELGVKIEGGNTKENIEQMAKTATEDLPS